MSNRVRVGDLRGRPRHNISIRPDSKNPGRVFLSSPSIASLSYDQAVALANLIVDTAEGSQQSN